MTRRILAALLFISFWTLLNAQQNIEWRSDTYAGINSIYLNPSFSSQYPLKWDLNLVGIGFLLDNNYAYFRAASNLDFIKRRNNLDFQFAPDLDEGIIQPDPNALVLDFFKGDKGRYAMTNQRIEGPSFLFQINEENSVGFFTGFRNMFSTQNVPGAFSYYTYDPFPLYTAFEVDKLDGAIMNWAEYGLHYSHKTAFADGNLSLGINLKLLKGYETAYFNIEQGFNYTKLPNDSIQGDQAAIAFGLTRSALDQQGNYRPTANGTGFGMSLGMNYTADAYDGDKPYQYRIGFSLLDFGAIGFSQNAESHYMSTNNLVDVTSRDYRGLNAQEDMDEMIKVFSYQVLGDSTASKIDDKFSVWLPGALSIQADYAITSYLFASAAIIQRLPVGAVKVRRDNYVNLTPRFESRWFGAGIPVSLYNYDKVKIGATLRLGYLIIGTENLRSWITKAPYSGTDFYVALKVNPFNLAWGGFGGNSGPKRKRGKVKCYDFN